MAVYTKITDKELAKFLENYNISQVISFQGIAEGVENTNYLIKTQESSYILTIYEKRVKSSDLPFFLGLMDHLASSNFPCPIPIHTKKGEILSFIANKPAALISFINGKIIDHPNENHCYQIGESIANLHITCKDFAKKRENSLLFDGWKKLIESCSERHSKISVDLEKKIHAEYDFLSESWPTILPTGVIHADLFTDNAFFTNDKLSGIIDFYFACNDFFAYDIAICINAWCFNNNIQFNIKNSESLINGYQKIRKLTQEEKQYMPILFRGAAFRFFLTRLYDLNNYKKGAFVKPKDPMEFWKILSYHQLPKNPKEYGFE